MPVQCAVKNVIASRSGVSRVVGAEEFLIVGRVGCGEVGIESNVGVVASCVVLWIWSNSNEEQIREKDHACQESERRW